MLWMKEVQRTPLAFEREMWSSRWQGDPRPSFDWRIYGVY